MSFYFIFYKKRKEQNNPVYKNKFTQTNPGFIPENYFLHLCFIFSLKIYQRGDHQCLGYCKSFKKPFQLMTLDTHRKYAKINIQFCLGASLLQEQKLLWPIFLPRIINENIFFEYVWSFF